MAASSVIGALRVNLGLDSASFDSGLSKSEKRAKTFQSNMAGIAKRVTVAFAAIISVGATAQAADQWSDLSARVGNAVGSMEAAPAVMNRISQMARKSYSDLGQTTEAFLGNSTALKELGFSTERQLDFTEALNNALVINGTRGERAAAVTKAITDAMATGKMEGDGFNTVLKDGDRIAKALAKELGTTVGGLRQMQKDGKITSDVISRALLGSLEELRREAGDMPATIGDGITLIRNSFVTLVGAFDRVFMASGGVANAFVMVADAMSQLAKLVDIHGKAIAAVFQQVASTVAVAASAIAVKYVAGLGVMFIKATIDAIKQTIALNMALGATSRSSALASGGVKLLTSALITLRGAMISTGIGALVVGAGYLLSKFVDLVQSAGSFGQAMVDLGRLSSATWNALIASAGAIPSGLTAVWQLIKADFLQLIASLQLEWYKFVVGIGNTLRASGFEDLASKFGAAGDELGRSLDATLEAQSSAMEAAAANGQRAADTIKDAFAPVGQMWRRMTGGEMYGPFLEEENATDTKPPPKPPGGDGKGANKIKEVMDKLREQYALLKETKGMTEAQVAAWQAMRDAGVKATSAIGREITKLTSGIASMSVLNDLATQLNEARATANMTDLETSIWQKQQEAGVDAQSANGRIIDQQMRQIQNMKDLKTATNQWRDSVGGALSEFITKGGSFKDVLKSILTGFADIMMQTGFNSIWGRIGSGGGFGSLLSGMGIGRNANGTNNWRGGWTSLHERGGEIVNLPRGAQVIPNDISKRMADASTAQSKNMNVGIGFDRSVGGFTALIRDEAGNVLAQAAPGIVRDSVQSTDRAMRKNGRFGGMKGA